MPRTIEDYIAEEKEFSRFKLITLEQTSGLHKNRLIRKEREFIDFDFESIRFSSLEECRNALNLFKVSKRDFILKYNIKSKESIGNSQISFLDDKKRELKVTGAGEVDNFRFRSLKGKAPYKDNGEYRSTYQKIISLCESIVDLMKMYVEEFGCAPKSIEDIFQQKYIKRIPKDSYLFSSLEMLKDDMFSCISKKTEKTSLLVFNIPHSGNEKINIVSMQILNNNGEAICVQKNKFFNCNIDGSYYKSIPISSDDANDVNLAKSEIYIGKSRRFMDHLSDVKTWAKLIRLHLEEIV